MLDSVVCVERVCDVGAGVVGVESVGLGVERLEDMGANEDA